jgi:hypothetical protein
MSTSTHLVELLPLLLLGFASSYYLPLLYIHHLDALHVYHTEKAAIVRSEIPQQRSAEFLGSPGSIPSFFTTSIAPVSHPVPVMEGGVDFFETDPASVADAG